MAATSYDAAVADACWVVFDFETTGLSVAEGARIVEIGALKLEGGRVTDHLVTLVDPEVPIPPAATAIHGLYWTAATIRNRHTRQKTTVVTG